jgi:hypothetical protein
MLDAQLAARTIHGERLMAPKKPETKPEAPKQEAPLAMATSRMEALAYSSPLAASLVQQVPEADRAPLLGDLLAAVQPYAGEGYVAETAEEVVHRLTAEVADLRSKNEVLTKQATQLAMDAATARADATAVRTSMAAKRAPQSALVGRFGFLGQLLREAGEEVSEVRPEETALAEVLRERKSLREALGETVKTGVVAFLRDDSADGVSERYTLFLGEVKDGRMVLSETVGGNHASWVDMRPIVESKVVPYLTPLSHGGRR